MFTLHVLFHCMLTPPDVYTHKGCRQLSNPGASCFAECTSWWLFSMCSHNWAQVHSMYNSVHTAMLFIGAEATAQHGHTQQ